jgi:hypothetical protein
MPRQSHPSWFDYSPHYDFLQSPVTPPLRSNILLSTLSSDASNKFHNHAKQQVKLWFCAHTFLESRREDKRFRTSWLQTFPKFNNPATTEISARK